MTPFHVRTTCDLDDLPAGSSVLVERINKRTYSGLWASQSGSWDVTIPKDACERTVSHMGMQVPVSENATALIARRLHLKRVWFAYHKAASRAAGRNVLTVHWAGACHQVNHIDCCVFVATHSRRQQPHCILRGWARKVTFTSYPGSDRGRVAIIE